jgi:hypothetical protein
MWHLDEWNDDKAEVLNNNAQAVVVGIESHKSYPEESQTIKVPRWGAIGISGVNALANKTNIRGRLFDRAKDAGILLDRGGPIAIADEHLIIDPYRYKEWGDILVQEADTALEGTQHPYSAIYLDTYGRLPYFLTANGLTPTAEDARAWDNFELAIVRRFNNECKRWGVGLYVNGWREHDRAHLVSGTMYENIPNEPTWMNHFDDIYDGYRIYNQGNTKGLIVGERGGEYREECLALAMIFDCWFATHNKPATPYEVVTADCRVAGEWVPAGPVPRRRANPLKWKRKFFNPREKLYNDCIIEFDASWTNATVTLPWE